MYINNSELCKLEFIIGILDGALERNPTNFIEGYENIKEDIKKAQESADKVREREIMKRAKQIAKRSVGK